MAYRPIEDYALIGNGLTAALVSRDGSIDWACFPRFDAPSIFGRLLDDRRGGSLQAAPADRFSTSRRYLHNTNVLLTRFRTDAGEVEVIDFMPIGDGVTAPHRLMKRVRGVSGRVRMSALADPRFDYARRDPQWSTRNAAAATATAAGESIEMTGTVPWTASPQGARAEFDVAEGDTHWIVARYRAAGDDGGRGEPFDAAEAQRYLNAACDHWRRWIARCVRTAYSEAVCRSALVLKLLDYEPTGAMVAAATTSLPERIGGVRNWDYRYAWVRDTAFCVYAFSLLGQFNEGERFFEWLLGVAGDGPQSLQVMYGVEGERDLTEITLDHLEGYEQSRPVRIGNGAYDQLQLDAYGDLMDCAFLLQKAGRRISNDLWPFLRATADHVTTIWTAPDQGIWEMRSPPQHFVASKAHCLMALRRAATIARRGGLEGDLERWDRAADAIMRQIRSDGIDPATGSFRQAYGSDQVDAALLGLQLRKIVKPDDPHMRATVRRIEQELDASRRDGSLEPGLIRRYRTSKVDDGLPPGEGVFLMCSFWLVDVYAEAGRVDEAQRLFERLLGYANDVGLYAEEFDPFEKRHLGNFPQAFTHVALINAAAGLEEASRA